MKHYCICPEALILKYSYLFSPRDGAHYTHIAGGEVLACVSFENELNEHHWYEIPGVKQLPHPQFEGHEPLHHSHVEQMKNHITDLEHGHTILHLAKHVAQIHPLMRLSRFLKIPS